MKSFFRIILPMICVFVGLTIDIPLLLLFPENHTINTIALIIMSISLLFAVIFVVKNEIKGVSNSIPKQNYVIARRQKQITLSIPKLTELLNSYEICLPVPQQTPIWDNCMEDYYNEHIKCCTKLFNLTQEEYVYYYVAIDNKNKCPCIIGTYYFNGSSSFSTYNRVDISFKLLNILVKEYNFCKYSGINSSNFSFYIDACNKINELESTLSTQGLLKNHEIISNHNDYFFYAIENSGAIYIYFDSEQSKFIVKRIEECGKINNKFVVDDISKACNIVIEIAKIFA